MLVATVEVSAWGHADDPRGDTPDGALASFGTSDGHLYGSTDEGATWNELASGLPPIHRILVLPLAGVTGIARPARGPGRSRPHPSRAPRPPGPR